MLNIFLNNGGRFRVVSEDAIGHRDRSLIASAGDLWVLERVWLADDALFAQPSM
jgi:hypothetical protein